MPETNSTRLGPYYASTPEIAQRRRQFYDALRSGKYEQTTGFLAAGPTEAERRYCCLGVACEVSGLAAWMPTSSYSWSYIGEKSLPASQVKEYYEFQDNNPQLFDERDTENMHATDLNDTLGWSFEQIADAFERVYPAEVAPNGL